MRKRLENILKRMVDGDAFYTNFSPRITNAEIKELWDLGFALQKEAMNGAESPTPWIVYPLHKEEFKKQVEKLRAKQ